MFSPLLPPGCRRCPSAFVWLRPFILGCLWVLVASIPGMNAAETPARPLTDPVPTAAGPVRGMYVAGADEDHPIHVYKGLPFAAPPVGDLRWKPPQPCKPWTEPRPCLQFGPWCPQPKPVLGKIEGEVSEDCLYLNIWTGAKTSAEKRPVMVWIHGGGYTTGSGSSSVYDGTHLAVRGVVLVTINYRLGPFGFFAHPALSAEAAQKVSGNYGMLDQVAALQWVHDNIAQFGGDPGNVTIFGESAGSASVTRLMVCPLAKDLFHKAIAESGGPYGRNRDLKQSVDKLPSMESVGVELAGNLGVAADLPAEKLLAALRAVPADKLLSVSDPAQGLFGKGTKFGPVVDGYALPADPGKLWNDGKQMQIPFITGSNADEGTIFLQQLPIKGPLGYRLAMRAFMQDDAEAMLKLFPATNETDVKAQLNKVVAVGSFIAPAREMVRAHEKIQAPVWLYHFTRVPVMGTVTSYGAFHSAEIFYVFGNFVRPVKEAPADTALATVMQDAWVQFARTGNPSRPTDLTAVTGVQSKLGYWPAYTAKDDRYLEFGDQVKVQSGLYREACDLLHARLDKLFAEHDPEAAGAEPPPPADGP